MKGFRCADSEQDENKRLKSSLKVSDEMRCLNLFMPHTWQECRVEKEKVEEELTRMVADLERSKQAEAKLRDKVENLKEKVKKVRAMNTFVVLFHDQVNRPGKGRFHYGFISGKHKNF